MVFLHIFGYPFPAPKTSLNVVWPNCQRLKMYLSSRFVDVLVDIAVPLNIDPSGFRRAPNVVLRALRSRLLYLSILHVDLDPSASCLPVQYRRR